MSDTRRPEEWRAIEREQAEPEEEHNPWPNAVWLFFGVMIGWGATYTAFHAGDGLLAGGDQRSVQELAHEDSAAVPSVDGAQVYQRVCMSCHQSQGEGLPGVFPPLAGSEWVTGDGQVPINIILKGLQGPIVVKGQTYNGVMPAFGDQLRDDEIAAVVTYIRSSWGNQAAPVTAADVAGLRQTHQTRTTPWRAEELQ